MDKIVTKSSFKWDTNKGESKVEVNKRKKYYKVSEQVWLKEEKKNAIVKSIDTKTYEATIEVDGEERVVKLWDITKLKSHVDKKPITKQAKGLDHSYNQVKAFHKAFNHPIAYVPTFMDAERAKARMSWVFEESNEFLDAKTVVDQADAMIDCIYFALGTLVELGVKPQIVMDIVQEANMSKLHDGKPVYNEMGKVVKPEGWVAPEAKIEKEIMRQASKRK